MNLFDLTGKKAIVTGGCSGLGRGMAEGLMQAGAHVVLLDVSQQTMCIAAEFRALGFCCDGVLADIGEAEACEEAFALALELLGGRLDILIPAAGIQRRNKAEEFTAQDWDNVLCVNLTAVFRLNQLAGRVMLAQGEGKIINIASMLSFFGGYTVSAYAASKGGVMQLTKALSNEWAGRGLNVNAIAPGYMDTQMNTSIKEDEQRNREILSRIPAGRWGTAADLKGLAVFLASHASDYLNGAIIPVDGGYLSR